MSKSFKFKNNMYLDSKSIVHNKKNLSEILNKMQIKSKKVSGNTGEYGNIPIELDVSKYIILEILVTSISYSSNISYGSPMALRIGSSTHYAHIIGDQGNVTIENAQVTLTVYYVET